MQRGDTPHSLQSVPANLSELAHPGSGGRGVSSMMPAPTAPGGYFKGFFESPDFARQSDPSSVESETEGGLRRNEFRIGGHFPEEKIEEKQEDDDEK